MTSLLERAPFVSLALLAVITAASCDGGDRDRPGPEGGSGALDCGTPSVCDAGCTADTDCDDGLCCNGPERGAEGGACAPGSAPVLDDGVDCPVDACDDAADSVTHTPD